MSEEGEMNEYNVDEIPLEYQPKWKSKSAPECPSKKLLISPYISPLCSSEPQNVRPHYVTIQVSSDVPSTFTEDTMLSFL